ncbi:MAG: TraB domain-containing protein [Candidatus Methanofastidiosia archaeon]
MKEEVLINQRKIIILGTIHAHQESVTLVRNTIKKVHPDHVAVELDAQRLEALESGYNPVKITDYLPLLKKGFRTAVILYLISYSNQKKAQKVGVPLMSDMLEAVKTARELGIPVALIDTAQPEFDLPFLEFVKLTIFLIKNSMREIPTDEESLKKFGKDLHKAAPSLSVIVDRDEVMARNIRELSGTTVVVTGMGHVKNIKRLLTSSDH